MFVCIREVIHLYRYYKILCVRLNSLFLIKTTMYINILIYDKISLTKLKLAHKAKLHIEANMKRLLLFIFISIMTFDLWGCSSVPIQQESSVESDATENINNESTVSAIDWDDLPIIFKAPDDVKVGDFLAEGTVYPQGVVYFDEVSVNNTDDIIALLKKYDLYQTVMTDTVSYLTTRYYGFIVYLEDDLYSVTKQTEDYFEDYLYGKDGLVSFSKWGTPPKALTHGEKIDDTTVYIDTAITDIKSDQSLDLFFDLISKHFGEYNSDNDYTFVTEAGRITLFKRDYGYNVYESSSYAASLAYIEHDFEYAEDKTLIQHLTYASDGKGNKYRLWEKDEDMQKTEWLNDGTTVQTQVKYGRTTINKQKDSKCIYYYKSDFIESFLTYNENGVLVGYKAISLQDGEEYDWVLDGNGYDASNYVSVTITKNGSSKTYVGKNQIPWGAAIFYPPKVAGSYQ